MMSGSQARSSLPQGWSQTVESRINIGLDKERDFYGVVFKSRCKSPVQVRFKSGLSAPQLH